MRIRDELGELFADAEFAVAFGARGRPGWSPGRLALVLVLQKVENLTDRAAAHLDEEYARLGRRLAAKLARKRPPPLLRGDRRIWAAGVVYALGRVNFLSDASTRPHLQTDQLAELFGIKQQTMANKGRLIMDTLRISVLDPEWTRRDMIEANPRVWFIQVDGFVVDARMLPEERQVVAWQRGLVPYVPARGE
jgi:Domain of unknown function (DUF6398)